MTNANRSVLKVKRLWTSEARGQRQRATPAEDKLWEALRHRRLAGLKFRRNQPIQGFYVDFLCAEHDLVIEVDGGIHLEQTEYDEARTGVLKRLGLRVIRFQNEEVLDHLVDVLTRIQLECSR